MVAKATLFRFNLYATPAISINTVPAFDFQAVAHNKVTAAFDGGRMSSDGGVMLLAAVERRLGIAERLAALIADARGKDRVTQGLADMVRARILAIACGY